ncbi:MAG: YeeE/YedE thiosulfate transporter family protein [Rhizobiaceae bacterium]
MFGLNMQLGGGCSSATLFTVGGGSSRMLVTLLFFIVGALIGGASAVVAGAVFTADPSLGTELGVPLALAVTLAGLGAVAVLSALVERHARFAGGGELRP